MRIRSYCRLLLLLSLTGTLAAQPASTTFRTSLLESVSVGYSYSSREDLSHDGGVGDVAVQRFDFSFSGRRPWSDSVNLVYGFAYAGNELDHSPGSPLPENLRELSLNLGVTQKLSAKWSWSAFLRPGFYGDFEDIDGDSFNAPLLALAQYAPRRELAWMFGLSVNPFSDHPVMPVAGVRWQFAPAWTFNLGFPQAGFVYVANPKLKLRAGVSFQGGSFRVTRNLGVPAPGIDRLANTFLDYREVRAGLGADVGLGEKWSLALDAGAVTDRKFDYFERDYSLNGDAGWYGGLFLRTSF
jgi:hypothetical protein